ncbi:MAG: molecular chaperone TorD family protein [Geminicoccaceae bacterium]|nr:molecular chaperone TorD family protein [Geminicoccaceae bacterium]
MSAENATGLAPEDRARAQAYELLARLLAAPPDADLLKMLAMLEGGETPIGAALAELAARAAETDAQAARDEYEALFIGVGRGELVPHGSYYITGFLNEKPLARLRADLRGMGVGRTDGNKVPEDHIASLLEVMAGLIEGGFGEARDGAGAQQAAHAFFHAHIALWAGRFFADLEKANAARLYVPVGTLGRHFVTIEEAAFEIAA